MRNNFTKAMINLDNKNHINFINVRFDYNSFVLIDKRVNLQIQFCLM